MLARIVIEIIRWLRCMFSHSSTGAASFYSRCVGARTQALVRLVNRNMLVTHTEVAETTVTGCLKVRTKRS